ncbi:MAG: methylmalonyl Co-A mutase-associated GTPase MeaB, partial [Candidatus Cloacimonadaceae bacterium]|nr:methylmalonyl Co-A mutase-associated GTPase MeaB [Candidatus Cloacimonadaceae bacterium]
GQSEITVRSMVDFFLLMQISGAGDDLQGIKKGIMELADLIVINKADKDNVLSAEAAAGELNRVLHYLQNATPDWHTKATTCSALEKSGLDRIWEAIESFLQITKSSEFFWQRRQRQNLDWFEDLLKEALLHDFFANPHVLEQYKHLKQAITEKRISPAAAVKDLLSYGNDLHQIID